MKTYFDCIPCFTRQALDAARFASDDKNVHERVLRKALKAVSEINMSRTPPEMGALIYRIVSEQTGNPDPYCEIKKTFNKIALDLVPDLKKITKASSNRFETAVRLAVAGNIIDFGTGTSVDRALLLKTIEKTLKDPLYGSLDRFKTSVERAEKILYLGDNSGEIVFDRLFIEHIAEMKGGADGIIFAVRGFPVINDVTVKDAIETGVTDIVRVIDNGQGYPGTVLSECSDSFLKTFNDVDLVISKGQGNYETLSGEAKNIFFLLKAKCSVVAQDLGCKTGVSVVGRAGDFTGMV